MNNNSISEATQPEAIILLGSGTVESNITTCSFARQFYGNKKTGPIFTGGKRSMTAHDSATFDGGDTMRNYLKVNKIGNSTVYDSYQVADRKDIEAADSLVDLVMAANAIFGLDDKCKHSLANHDGRIRVGIVAYEEHYSGIEALIPRVYDSNEFDIKPRIILGTLEPSWVNGILRDVQVLALKMLLSGTPTDNRPLHQRVSSHLNIHHPALNPGASMSIYKAMISLYRAAPLPKLT